MSGTSRVAAMVGIAMLAALSGCSNNGTSAGKTFRLNGSGSSFVNPIMTKWADVYNREKGVEVNYQSAGSGQGVQQMTKRTVHFGCTDAPMNKQQLDEARKIGGEVLHIPLVMGGVVPAYNVPEVTQPLKFTGQVLADIYTGKITKWNDPNLQKLNEGVSLPDRKILVVYRSEPSGTTYTWVEYLSKASKDWKLGVKTSIEWPVGEGAKGSEGMAGKLAKAEGTIGYVELLYALQKGIKYGAVQNSAGEFLQADLESVTTAANNSLSTIKDDLRYSLTNAPGKGSYPICATTWAVIYVFQPRDEGPEVVKFLQWILHEGQEQCAALKYARLSSGLVERAEKKLEQVHFAQ